MSKILPNLLFLFTVFCLGITIFLSQDIASGIFYGINICLSSLIPSLYFFMILSNFVQSTKLKNVISRPFRFIGRKLFRLDDSLFSIFLLSMLGGYPIGAKLIADQLRNGSISKETGQYMLNFCINCSPAFLISFLSVTIWNSLSIGFILYAAQLTTCILIAFVTGYKKPIQTPQKVKQQSSLSVSTVLVQSVNQATKTMVTICSFVIVFCGIFSLIEKLPFNDTAHFFLRGLSEVTSGCQRIASLPTYSGIVIASLFTSFGGICVFLQVAALLSGCQISFSRWLLMRIPYTVLSVFFTYLGIRILKPVIPAISKTESMTVELFTASPAAFAGMLILSGMLLLFSFGTQTLYLPDIKNFYFRKK